MAVKKPAYDEPSYFWESIVVVLVAVLALFMVASYQGFVPWALAGGQLEDRPNLILGKQFY